MTTLWICEKYAAAHELARVLFGGVASHSPPLIVTKQAVRLVYTNGHALELADPEVYDAAYKSWDHQDMTRLVQGGFRLVAAPEKSAAVSAIEAEIGRASEIVVATDAGREGEMIAWEILDHAGCRTPVRRFWTSSLTDNAMRSAAAKLLPGETKRPLYHAGQARSRADWVEGLTYTRYFTRHHGDPKGKPLSVGRVQSAVTALIEDRCREIETFTARPYFEVETVLDTPHGAIELSYRPSEEQRIENRSEAEAIASRIMGQTALLSVKTMPKATRPVDFMTTSGAQKRAFNLWKWTPQHTLALLQKLYEAKFVTYPRTECLYLSHDHASQMPGLLARLAILPEIQALAEARPDWIAKPVIRPASYDDAKLTDHHAIIPTETVPDQARLAPDEAKLYLLIVRHMVANLLPDFLYDSTTVTAELDGKPFMARGRTTRELGWRTLISEDRADRDAKRARKRKKASSADDMDQGETAPLPPVENGDRGSVREAGVLSKQTTPPAHFTQASLLDAMVNIDLYIDDPRAKAVLGGPSPDQKRGIGTGATRANIIMTVFDRGYVEERDTAIHTTTRGRTFVDLVRRLVPWMADPLHSVDQEEALQAIEAGKGSADLYLSAVLDRTCQTIAKLQEPSGPPRSEDSARLSVRRGSRNHLRRRTESRPSPRSTEAVPTAAVGKVYFSVPYEKRAEAKAAGLRWDPDARKWYATPETAKRLAAAGNFPFPAARTL